MSRRQEALRRVVEAHDALSMLYAYSDVLHLGADDHRILTEAFDMLTGVQRFLAERITEGGDR